MEVARIASLAGTNDSEEVLARAHASDRAPQAAGRAISGENQGGSNMKKLSRLTMLLAGLLALTTFAPAQQKTQPQGQRDQSKLVEIVRGATQQYQDVSNAVGYSPALGCVSGSDHGAMGIHYVNGSLLNGPIDPTHPQALIYEPQSNGELKLVGVEFIILASALPPNAAPQVEGHLMLFVDGPNRYGLPPFFELHVWAWRDNPQGPFVDWNDHVSCAGQ
jgi:hypothetical protein